MALAHKRLDAAVELCWHSDRKKLAFSGQHLVPVLLDGGRAVNDSWNIACYLDEAYPDRPTLMDGAQGRSFALFLNSWMDSIIGRPLVRSLYLDILQSLHPQADAQEFRGRREERNGATLEALHANRAKDFAEINRMMLPLNELLRRQPFVAGGAPSEGANDVPHLVFPYRHRHADWAQRCAAGKPAADPLDGRYALAGLPQSPAAERIAQHLWWL
jgi:glutathione S-transferase